MEAKNNGDQFVWLNVRVAPEVRRAVKQRAVDTDKPMAEVVEQIIRRGLKIPYKKESVA